MELQLDQVTPSAVARIFFGMLKDAVCMMHSYFGFFLVAQH